MEYAVDAEANDEGVRLRLEVDVACAVLGRLEDDRVDEAHERSIGDAVLDLEIVQLIGVGDDLEVDDLFAEGRTGAPESLRGSREPAELGGDLFARRDAQRDRVAACEPQRVDPVDVLRIGDRDAERAVLERVGQRVDLLEHVQRHRVRCDRVDADRSELDHGEPVLCGDDACDGLARCESLVDQHLHDRGVLHRLPQRREFPFGNQAGRLEQVDDELAHQLRDRCGSDRPFRRRSSVRGHRRLSGHRRLVT